VKINQGMATDTPYHYWRRGHRGEDVARCTLKPAFPRLGTSFLTANDVINLHDPPTTNKNIKVKKSLMRGCPRLNQFSLLIFVQGAAGGKAPLAR